MFPIGRPWPTLVHRLDVEGVDPVPDPDRGTGSVHTCLQVCTLVDMSHHPAPRTAVIYTRVSTGRQAESGLSLDDQLARCTAAVAARGWTLAAHLTDAGVSGKRAVNRPGLIEARRMLAAGEADALVVAKMDRLARSTIDTARILDDSRREGWALVLLDLDLDTSTPSGELVANVIAATAQYESRIIGERVGMAHRERRARGVRAGSTPELPEPVRRRIADERAAGGSFRAIADRLNADEIPTARGGRWHASTVRHVVQSVDLDATLAANAAAYGADR